MQWLAPLWPHLRLLLNAVLAESLTLSVFTVQSKLAWQLWDPSEPTSIPPHFPHPPTPTFLLLGVGAHQPSAVPFSSPSGLPARAMSAPSMLPPLPDHVHRSLQQAVPACVPCGPSLPAPLCQGLAAEIQQRLTAQAVVQENLMQVLHHNAQGYHSGQAFKKPQKAPRMAAGADSVASAIRCSFQQSLRAACKSHVSPQHVTTSP